MSTNDIAYDLVQMLLASLSTGVIFGFFIIFVIMMVKRPGRGRGKYY